MNTNPLYVQLDLGGVWYITFFFGIAATLVLALKRLSLPLPAKLFWAYTLLYSLFYLEFPLVYFGEMTNVFKLTAGQVFVETLFVPLTVLFFWDKIERLIPYAVAFALLCAWAGWPGLFNAGSFNLAFAALGFMFCPLWLRALVVATVATHHGNTAALILAAHALAYGFKGYGWKYWRVALLALALLFLALYAREGSFVGGFDRLQKYELFMRFWANDWRWIGFGVGPGSFVWTSFMLDDKNRSDLFVQMHSDWLQIAWELGAAGFGLAVWTWISAVRIAWGKVEVLSALFGCAAFALTYHPLRYYPSAILTAYIFFRAYSVVNQIHVQVPGRVRSTE